MYRVIQKGYVDHVSSVVSTTLQQLFFVDLFINQSVIYFQQKGKRYFIIKYHSLQHVKWRYK